MTKILYFIKVALIFTGSFSIAQPISKEGGKEAKTIVFTGVNIIPMNREVVLKNMTLVVKNGRISAFGNTKDIAIPEDAEVINKPGMFLLPGLIDMHTHIDKKEHLNHYLVSGVTTIRNGHGNPKLLAIRNDIADGKLSGPNFLVASPAFVLQPYETAWQATTPQIAREGIRKFKEEGYDWIKSVRLADEVFFAMVDEARKVGISTGGHLPNFDTPLEELINSGWSSVEHIREIVWSELKGDYDIKHIPALVEKVRVSGITVSTLLNEDMTLKQMKELKEGYLKTDKARKISEIVGEDTEDFVRDFVNGKDEVWNEVLKRVSFSDEFIFSFIFQLHEAGVLMVAGADSFSQFGAPGDALFDELELFTKAGLTPYEALKTATYNAAKHLEKMNDIGTIEIGKQADFVLYEKNPLEDIQILRKPAGVMIRGEWTHL